jgi:hypothetical protein
MREWLRYWKRVALRAAHDTHLLDKRRVFITIGAALLGVILPADLTSLDIRNIWKVAVFSALSYVILTSVEYVARFLHSPSLLDRDRRQSITDIENRIAVVEATQPAVQLRIEDRSIVVHNSGAFGTCVAHLRIIKHNFEKLETADARKTYVGFWDHSLDCNRAEINNGQEDKLLLSSVGSFGLPGQMNFVFYYMEGKARREIPRVYTIGTPEPPSLVVEVTLSAKPELCGGAVVRRYCLTTEGMSEAT